MRRRAWIEPRPRRASRVLLSLLVATVGQNMWASAIPTNPSPPPPVSPDPSPPPPPSPFSPDPSPPPPSPAPPLVSPDPSPPPPPSPFSPDPSPPPAPPPPSPPPPSPPHPLPPPPSPPPPLPLPPSPPPSPSPAQPSPSPFDCWGCEPSRVGGGVREQELPREGGDEMSPGEIFLNYGLWAVLLVLLCACARPWRKTGLCDCIYRVYLVLTCLRDCCKR